MNWTPQAASQGKSAAGATGHLTFEKTMSEENQASTADEELQTTDATEGTDDSADVTEADLPAE